MEILVSNMIPRIPFFLLSLTSCFLLPIFRLTFKCHSHTSLTTVPSALCSVGRRFPKRSGKPLHVDWDEKEGRCVVRKMEVCHRVLPLYGSGMDKGKSRRDFKNRATISTCYLHRSTARNHQTQDPDARMTDDT